MLNRSVNREKWIHKLFDYCISNKTYDMEKKMIENQGNTVANKLANV